MYEFILRFAAFKFQEICLTRQLALWPITTHWFTFQLARSILIERTGSNINSKEHSTKPYTVQKSTQTYKTCVFTHLKCSGTSYKLTTVLTPYYQRSLTTAESNG